MSQDNLVAPSRAQQLKRELGLFGALVMGLGSVIGAGLFVSLGIATGVSGSGVILAIILAGFLALCSGFNSAQLAALHPVSGEAYEYGYQHLSPAIGFTGGWLYLIAKTATAATAALGFSNYLLNLLGISNKSLSVLLAECAVLLLTLIVLRGIRSSKFASLLILGITLSALILFIAVGISKWPNSGFENVFQVEVPTFSKGLKEIFEASALMFIAFAGYARVATMGEEIVEPQKTIPQAITLIVLFTTVLYAVVALISIGSIGAGAFATASNNGKAALEVVAESFAVPGVIEILALGAVMAMLNVLLNAILALSRVLLAMARRQDMPAFIARLDESGNTPYWAVMMIGVVIALIVLTGDVKVAWSFSAFAGLIRTAIINLAALKLDVEDQLYPRPWAWIGLLSCLFLAFWVEWRIWLVGLGLIGLGLIWHTFFQATKSAQSSLTDAGCG